MPTAHAILSPSAAHRWLHCTAAPRLEAAVEDSGSDYAREGSLAHAIGAVKLKTAMGEDTSEEMLEVDDLRDYYSAEMEEHTDMYRALVMEKLAAARRTTADARLLVETRLDLGEYVPEAFGTSDATIIADGLMEVVDFKYGKGVRVEAVHNEQMMIYALGAWLEHSPQYRIERVRMTIVQPRLDNVSEWEMAVADLLAWAEDTLRPKAAEAFAGGGKQEPGEWCRFCKVKCSCAALAGQCLGLAKESGDARLLSPERLASDVLPWLSVVKSWASSVEEFALQQALAGTRYEGFKLVEGRSVRRITDEESARRALADAGYDEAAFMKPAALAGLSELEKLVGKKKLAGLIGDYITKPQGKPTLVGADDKRPEFSYAGDFDGFD